MFRLIRKFLGLGIALLAVNTFWGCDKSVNPDNEDRINVVLKNTDDYEYNTAIGGDEDGAFIKKQAENYDRSEIIRDSSTNWVAVYRYKPKSGFVGHDSVELETHEGSDGASPPTKIEIIKIDFIVTAN